MTTCPRCGKWMQKAYAKGVCADCYAKTDGCCRDYSKQGRCTLDGKVIQIELSQKDKRELEAIKKKIGEPPTKIWSN